MMEWAKNHPWMTFFIVTGIVSGVVTVLKPGGLAGLGNFRPPMLSAAPVTVEVATNR